MIYGALVNAGRTAALSISNRLAGWAHLRNLACMFVHGNVITITHQSCYNYIRYGFQVAGSLLVFMLFWILLAKVNRTLDTANLDPSDERVFWVRKFTSYSTIIATLKLINLL